MCQSFLSGAGRVGSRTQGGQGDRGTDEPSLASLCPFLVVVTSPTLAAASVAHLPHCTLLEQEDPSTSLSKAEGRHLPCKLASEQVHGLLADGWEAPQGSSFLRTSMLCHRDNAMMQ